MVLVTLVDILGQIGLDAPHRPAVLRVALRHLELVDKAVVDFGQFFVLVDELLIFLHRLFRDSFLRIALFELQVDLMESHQFAQLVIVVGVHHIRVEAQHVAVGDAAGNRVFVQHVAKERLGGNLVLGILFKHGRAREAEEQRTGEGVLDADEHVAEHTAVALVDDEHQPLLADLVEQFLGDGSAVRDGCPLLQVAHLLDGGDNEAVVVVYALQFGEQHGGVCRVLYLIALARKAPVFVERLQRQFDAVEQEYHLVGISALGNQLRALERRHRLARTRGVPDVAAPVQVVVPVGLLHPVADLAHGKILVAAEHLQRLVLVVGNGVEAHHLMRHRDGEQVGGHLPPVTHDDVVEVFPMEIELWLEAVFRAGVGKVECLLGSHRHIDLHHREDAALEHPFVHIPFDLEAGLADIHLASLQFDMYHGHAVDEEHHIATAVASHLVGRLELWLSDYLVAALSRGDFHRVEYLQIHLLAAVVGVGLVVALDAHLLGIDESVHLVGRAHHVHLVHHLLHLRCRQRMVAQFVYLAVVVVDDAAPVLYKLLLGGVHNHLVPPVFEQVVGQCLFKGQFLDETLYVVSHSFLIYLIVIDLPAFL